MRIGVNARRLAGQRLGVARYIEYLIKHWGPLLGPTDTVTLYVEQPLPPGDLQPSDAFKVQHLDGRVHGLLWENLLLPRRAREQDVLFDPSYTTPLLYPGRSVLAIHSVNEAQPGTHPWWYQWTYSQIYRRSAHKADMVIVPSASTKEDIARLYGVDASKLVVVPQGVDDSFHPIDDPALLSATRRRYLGDDVPYLLFVGKLSQRRNIPILMQAFALLKQREHLPHRLLLVGPNHLHLPLEPLARELGITDSLVQTDGRFADHRELVAIYSAADLYVNASSYEGFSITLVEAMACGAPVVTVNRAALSEIAGGCAELVDAPDAEQLAAAIQRVLTDQERRQTLRARGLERARAFRWEETARATLDVLRQVGER